MSITTLDGKRFAEMILQGAGHLSNNAKYVDALNVFPVPDGDTGTNMNLSMTSGAKEVKNNVSEHIGKVGAALSKGLLMGARGNSGVILSQLFRGFSKAIESKSAITSADFANALQAGVNTAYKAVMKPVEGTILTVAKDSAKKAVDTIEADSSISIDQLMEAILTEAKASLDRTPDLLPVLKEVGVVDSGGQGLVFVYEGFLAELRGEKVSNIKVTASMTDLVSAEHHKSVASHINTEDIEFGYCTEFMVRFEDDKDAFTEETFRQDLSEHGDSLLVIADDEIVKVHIHAEYPGQVLTYAQRYGSLINMKIENMRQQHTSLLDNVPSMPAAEPVSKKKEKQKYGIVAVTMGKGIADLFRSIGSHSVIEGGQTMNPSTEDIVQAIKDVHAENVIILPNNSNIVMAAQQAASVVDDHVIVIPSKTVPQGMAAMLAFNPSASAEDNEEIMKDALGSVKTGQITYAVRDTNIDGLDIEKGDFMGIANGKIVSKDTNQLASAKKLLETMISEDDEILTILQGEDAADDELQKLVQFIEEKYTEIEVEVHKGEQPLYSYIFSIE
ncbi:DAK2 domain-containing protein [Bacillus sp. CMF21]|uniref:DAK2 domain-containing protein n=1 Tax=Metabacillus dongyingensis TaxID=2874282 RepID=UPI001CBE39D2|nr:DAK2 domain-containing protein [Metabacillus dongyingensis]UAL54219.1 DAK2 domain-containing protein [Metabacillus dongyingensis]USK30539.1 DAK2 domain-containing protein [Bacillus sp. CMF21]